MIRCYIGHSKGTVEAAVEELAAESGAIADLNRVVLDGDEIDIETLQVHCDTLPFMGGSKLVVVRGLLSRCLKEKPLREGLLAYLPGLPEHCALVLADPPLSRGRETTALTKVLRGIPGTTLDTADQRKGAPQIGWIVDNAPRFGCGITRRAAENLAAVSPDRDTIEQELAKLALYRNRSGTISEEDVHLLVPQSRESNIFAFADAVSDGRRQQALSLLHDLPNQEPGYVLVMIARQFRLVLKAKHALRTMQAPNEVARAIGLTRAPPRAVNRVISQARRFSIDQLASIHAHIARTDFAIKRSKMDPATALDLLVIGLCSIASQR
jgi:DNA polymerase-3 subunit delta